MQYPDQDTIQSVSEYLNNTFGYNYIIYNVSEYKYDATLFNNQVIEFTFPGYPNPPLETYFFMIKEIDSWLAIDDKHIIILHCQPSMVCIVNRGEALCF